MKIPFWLIILLFLLWGGWSFKNYYCDLCGHCGAKEEVVAPTGPAIPMFACNESTVPSADYKHFRDSIIATGGQGDTLTITGLYYADESEEIGQARASSMRRVLGTKIPDDRVRTATRALDGNCADAVAEGGFRGVAFDWSKMILELDEGAIIESDSSVTFLFPYNSTEKDRDPAVEAYLEKLIEKHKDTEETFNIVGHTDAEGSEKFNYDLGMRRAQAIEKLLLNGGIAQERLSVESKGKTEPIASNETDEGRHLNRRVVVTINQ